MSANKKRPVCTICKNVLESGDELLAEWYQPKRWWILRHVRDGDGDFCIEANAPFVRDFAKPTEQLVGASRPTGDPA